MFEVPNEFVLPRFIYEKIRRIKSKEDKLNVLQSIIDDYFYGESKIKLKPVHEQIQTDYWCFLDYMELLEQEEQERLENTQPFKIITIGKNNE